MIMKKIFFIIVCIVIAGISSAQDSKKKMTIEDYYLALPSNYFLCDQSDEVYSVKNKLAGITLSDLKNGYLEAQAGSFKLKVTLFKDKEKNKDIIAVYMNCGLGCMCNAFDFLTYKGNEEWEPADVFDWKLVDEYIAAVSEKTGKEVYIQYELPRIGTTIKGFDINTKKQLCEMKWEKGRFTLVKLTQ
jgi:hypothetical protein